MPMILSSCGSPRGTARPRRRKLFGLSAPIGHDAAADFAGFAAGARLYLSSGNSSRTDLAAGSVDAVITDPPFFDNVHYSRLADFFHVWQRHVLSDDRAPATTRAPGEVQHSDATAFTERLGAVWRECCRVLKDDGLLVFTYHHSRAEGWASILAALMDAGFVIAAAHPIKSEMSVATPKHQAKEPIDLDMILVCRKRDQGAGDFDSNLWGEVMSVARHQVARLRATGRWLSRNDLRIIVMAQLVRRLSRSETSGEALAVLEREGAAAELEIEGLQGQP